MAPSYILCAVAPLVLGVLPAAEHIKIQILEGDGAVNSIQARRAKEPVIRVETESGAPVAGAAVHFTTPTVGPGAVFADGNATLTTVTDGDGRAGAPALRPNRVAGQFQIRVTASYLGQTASARIIQTNAESPTASKGSSKKIAIFAILGAAVAGVTLATQSGGKNTAPVAAGTVITLGSPALGAP